MAGDEGNVDADNRAVIYRFDIQHITPREAFKDPETAALLNRAGITVDMRGNKVALLANGDLVQKLLMFWPLAITMPKGKIHPKQYFGMVIGTFLDSFEPGMSAEGSWEKSKDYDSYRAFRDTKQYVSGLALSLRKRGGAHLWRERRIRRPSVWFSDVLHDEITRAGLRIPKHIKAKEI